MKDAGEIRDNKDKEETSVYYFIKINNTVIICKIKLFHKNPLTSGSSSQC